MRIVLISCKQDDKENVMTAAWCFPLSAEPALFGICISKKRYSYKLIHSSRKFAINIPSSELKNASIVCGRNSGKEINKFKLAKLTKEYGKLDIPLIKESIASIECDVTDEHEFGDHILFVGKAENIIKRKEGKGIYHLGGDEIIEL